MDDSKFRQDFAGLSIDTAGRRKNLAKYILARLECDISERACDPDTDAGSVEHVLPENPGSELESTLPKEQWDRAINRLGNLTILEPPLNRQVGNATFTEKVAAYGKSAYAITRQIPDYAPDEWNLARLEARQERMAQRGVHLWRADFA
ncbi:MAG: HNH endonuclease family protein [Syntrophobacteraceae bacterium]